MSELRKLTWKYFWEQKWEEIKEPLLVISGISGFVGFCLLIAGMMEDINLMFTIGLCMMIPATLFIITCIINWIRNNWRKAFKRAEEELEVTLEVDKAIEDLNQETIL